MRALVTSNIYDLNILEKLKILKTLCAQLLTYATTRDIIDDGFDRLIATSLTSLDANI